MGERADHQVYPASIDALYALQSSWCFFLPCRIKNYKSKPPLTVLCGNARWPFFYLRRPISFRPQVGYTAMRKAQPQGAEDGGQTW